MHTAPISYSSAAHRLQRCASLSTQHLQHRARHGRRRRAPTDWGAARRTYYGGDTADLEIGQDEDAVEEEAPQEQQPRRWRRWTRTTSLTVAMTMRGGGQGDLRAWAGAL